VSESEILALLQTSVGRPGSPRLARDPVDASMIRQWSDAFGDRDPLYIDPARAAVGPFGAIVAPPAMLDVWDKPGLGADRGDGPLASVLALLDAEGLGTVVALDHELGIDRYLRLGDVVSRVETVEVVSDEEQTALGEGRFVTTRSTFTDQHGERVGATLQRLLAYRPSSGHAVDPTAGVGVAAPDPDPALRPRPAINRDNQFFWDGARQHELRVQTCDDCGAAYFPPTPRCAACSSFALGWRVSSGRGTVYATAVPHHPQANGFRYPLAVALIELEEGVRLVSNIVGIETADLRIGLPVEVCWLDSHPALVEGADDARGPITLPQFRPRTPPRRETTSTVDDVGVGYELPMLPIPITSTLVLATAFVTRTPRTDDLSTNIETSVGFAQRYLTDTLGPAAMLRDLRVHVREPNHPGDITTFTGSITAVDADSGAVDVSLRAINERGVHLTGTAAVVLPGGAR
jgi:uncharacterized OB-fold protein/acyl dehydratase